MDQIFLLKIWVKLGGKKDIHSFVCLFILAKHMEGRIPKGLHSTVTELQSKEQSLCNEPQKKKTLVT